MKKIMLACSAGMSTSILVNKIISAAKEKGLEFEVFAVPTNEAINKLDEVDVCLLGPQVKFELPRFQRQAKNLTTKVAAIPAQDYGKANGEAVLNLAISLME